MKFKVVALSANQNSFGLRQIVLISTTGVGVKAAANALNLPKLNDVIITSDDFRTDMIRRGWELVDSNLPSVPPTLLQQTWGEEAEFQHADQPTVKTATDTYIKFIMRAMENGDALEEVVRGLLDELLLYVPARDIRELVRQLNEEMEPNAVESHHGH